MAGAQMRAVALVDYDNVCRSSVPENRPMDVAQNLEELLSTLSAQTKTVLPSLDDLHVRLYGGWLERSGRLTQRAAWLTDEVARFRRRMNGVRVRSVLATTIVALPDRELMGTYRGDAEDRQKMVDGMLTVDSLLLTIQEQEPVVIVSDDDDFVPALVASHSLARRPTYTVLFRRSKALGSAPNDALLMALPLTMRIC